MSMAPESVRDALTVMYGSVPSNTETDLVAITFPEATASLDVRAGSRN